MGRALEAAITTRRDVEYCGRLYLCVYTMPYPRGLEEIGSNLTLPQKQTCPVV